MQKPGWSREDSGRSIAASLTRSSLSRIMLRQWEETRAIATHMLECGDQELLVDFDSHLDDITKDWTNEKLNHKIEELASPANGSL